MRGCIEQTRLRRVRSAEDLAAVQAAAAADEHQVIGATHVIVKDGRVAGYVSLGGLPMLHAWASTGAGGGPRLTSRESLQMLTTAETLLAEQYGGVVLPCAGTSPFYPLLERLGYERLGETVLWAKQLRT